MHLKTLLILLASNLLIACKSLDNMPTVSAPTTLYQVDLKHDVCGVARLKTLEPLTYERADDKALDVCNGVVGLKVKDIQKLLRQIVELQEWKNEQLNKQRVNQCQQL